MLKPCCEEILDICQLPFRLVVPSKAWMSCTLNSYPLVSVTVVLSKQDILLLDVNSEFHFQINIIDMLEILKDGLDALQGS